MYKLEYKSKIDKCNKNCLYIPWSSCRCWTLLGCKSTVRAPWSEKTPITVTIVYSLDWFIYLLCIHLFLKLSFKKYSQHLNWQMLTNYISSGNTLYNHQRIYVCIYISYNAYIWSSQTIQILKRCVKLKAGCRLLAADGDSEPQRLWTSATLRSWRLLIMCNCCDERRDATGEKSKGTQQC